MQRIASKLRLVGASTLTALLLPCLCLVLQASFLSPAQLSQLRCLFDRADSLGVGTLSAGQVAALLRVALSGTAPQGLPAASVSEAQIRDLLAEADVGMDRSSGGTAATAGGEGAVSESHVGGDARADFDEFVNLFSRAYSAPTDEGAEADDDLGGEGQLLSAHEVAELKDAFARLDADGDGLLSTLELQQAFAQMGESMSLDEVECMIREVESNGRLGTSATAASDPSKGRISLAQFLATMSPQ